MSEHTPETPRPSPPAVAAVPQTRTLHGPRWSRFGRRLLGPFYANAPFWYRYHRLIAFHPEWARTPVTLFWVSFYAVMLRRIRRDLRSNQDVILGPCGWWQRQKRIWLSMWEWAWARNERWEQLRDNPPDITLQPDGLDHWKHAIASDQGILLMTGHVGNYESGFFIPEEVVERRIHVVREPEPDPGSQRFMEELFERYQRLDIVTHHETDDFRLGMALLGALRRGEIVIMTADRPREGSPTIDVPFFGRTLTVNSGAAMLARAAGVPMLPMFLLRSGRRSYRLVFHEPIHVVHSKDRDGDARDAMERYTSHVEDAIRQVPHQWFLWRSLWE